MSGSFLDSNIVVYAFSAGLKSERAQALLHAATNIGVQTLNEFANVSRRKAGRDWSTVTEHLQQLMLLFPNPVSIDAAVHMDGVRLAQRYGFSIWDSMIVAAALKSRADVLWSEDMHGGLVVDDRLLIANPFRAN